MDNVDNLCESLKCNGFCIQVGSGFMPIQVICLVCNTKYGNMPGASNSNYSFINTECRKIICPICVEKYDLESNVLIRG